MTPYSNLRVFYTHVILSWGFITRYPNVSAAQPAYIVPPPTTVVGAFAYPLARVLGLNPYRDTGITKWGRGILISRTMKVFLDATVAAAAGFVAGDYNTGIAVHQELGKLSASIYKTGGQRKSIKTKLMSDEFYEGISVALPVQALGASYGPGVEVILAWTIDVGKLLNELREKFNMNIDIDDFDKAAETALYGVTRLGSKESIVAMIPEKTRYIKKFVEVKCGSFARSLVYLPKRCVHAVDLTLSHELQLPNLKYELEQYYVPAAALSGMFITPVTPDKAPLFKVNCNCVGIGIMVSEKDMRLLGVM